MLSKKLHKGQIEKAKKRARSLLEQNLGINEIIEITGLEEQDIIKEQQKMRK